jgi:hypothetical protein
MLVGNIPLAGGVRTIQNVVISPGRNPYGTTSAKGIYVLDCGGQDVTIQNCRVVATLVLLNPGSNSQVAQSVSWRSYMANYPALLVKGHFSINTSNVVLSEATSPKTNYNPVGTGDGSTGEDGDFTDTYSPAAIQGLLYVSGNLRTSVDPAIDGCLVVGGTVTAATSLRLTYKNTYEISPPPGFYEPPLMRVQAGSWMPVVR